MYETYDNIHYTFSHDQPRITIVDVRVQVALYIENPLNLNIDKAYYFNNGIHCFVFETNFDFWVKDDYQIKIVIDNTL